MNQVLWIFIAKGIILFSLFSDSGYKKGRPDYETASFFKESECFRIQQ